MTKLQAATSPAIRDPHSVSCYPTQVNTPRSYPSQQAGTRFTYPGGMERWPGRPGNGTAKSRTGDLSITSPMPLHHRAAITLTTYSISSADCNFILSRIDRSTLWLIGNLLCTDDVTITQYNNLPHTELLLTLTISPLSPDR